MPALLSAGAFFSAPAQRTSCLSFSKKKTAPWRKKKTLHACPLCPPPFSSYQHVGRESYCPARAGSRGFSWSASCVRFEDLILRVFRGILTTAKRNICMASMYFCGKAGIYPLHSNARETGACPENSQVEALFFSRRSATQAPPDPNLVFLN